MGGSLRVAGVFVWRATHRPTRKSAGTSKIWPSIFRAPLISGVFSRASAVGLIATNWWSLRRVKPKWNFESVGELYCEEKNSPYFICESGSTTRAQSADSIDSICSPMSSRPKMLFSVN